MAALTKPGSMDWAASASAGDKTFPAASEAGGWLFQEVPSFSEQNGILARISETIQYVRDLTGTNGQFNVVSDSAGFFTLALEHASSAISVLQASYFNAVGTAIGPAYDAIFMPNAVYRAVWNGTAWSQVGRGRGIGNIVEITTSQPDDTLDIEYTVPFVTRPPHVHITYMSAARSTQGILVDTNGTRARVQVVDIGTNTLESPTVGDEIFITAHDGEI